MRSGKVPDNATLLAGTYGEVTTARSFYENKEYAPNDRRDTAELLLTAHTHSPHVWGLLLDGTPDRNPNFRSPGRRQGPSVSDLVNIEGLRGLYPNLKGLVIEWNDVEFNY